MHVMLYFPASTGLGALAEPRVPHSALRA
jgi:hypothetical protein